MIVQGIRSVPRTRPSSLLVRVHYVYKNGATLTNRKGEMQNTKDSRRFSSSESDKIMNGKTEAGKICREERNKSKKKKRTKTKPSITTFLIPPLLVIYMQTKLVI